MSTDLKQKPKVSNSFAEKEVDKVEEQFKEYDQQIKDLTLDRMNEAPKQEVEPQTKLSQEEIAKSKELYLKPWRTIGCRDKFNEAYRKDYEFAKEQVRFIAENHEIIGETIDIWTRPFGGMPAEWWKVPTNKPVWGPRYLAEQITRARYHRFIQDDNAERGADEKGYGYKGAMVVDKVIQRLDARPVSNQKSIFMGASSF